MPHLRSPRPSRQRSASGRSLVLCVSLTIAPSLKAAEAIAPVQHDAEARLAPSPTVEVPAEAPAVPAPLAPSDGTPMRLAVYDLEVDGLSERKARVLTDAVLFEVRKLSRISAIGMDEVRAMLDLEAQKQLVGCSAEESCLADIAGALGVDGLVIGALARVGDEHVFTLKRIDQREAATVATATKRLPAGDGEELLAVVGEMVETMFPDYALRSGATRGVAPEVGQRLNPPPLPTWVFWSGAGLSGVVLASSAVTASVWALVQADYRALADRSAFEPVDGASLKSAGARAQQTELLAWALLGTAGVTSAVTVVLALFTDFAGVGEEP